MSISTEITRIVNAKAAIKTAIEGKGVTVPDATLLDGMATLIDSIESGGGGENPFGRTYEVGSFVTAENVSYLQNVQHSLNTLPMGIIYWTEEDGWADAATAWAIAGWHFIFNIHDWTDVNTHNISGFGTSIYKAANSTNPTRIFPAYGTATRQSSSVYGPQTTVSHNDCVILRRSTTDKFDMYAPIISTYFPAGVLYHYILIGEPVNN